MHPHTTYTTSVCTGALLASAQRASSRACAPPPTGRTTTRSGRHGATPTEDRVRRRRQDPHRRRRLCRHRSCTRPRRAHWPARRPRKPSSSATRIRPACPRSTRALSTSTGRRPVSPGPRRCSTTRWTTSLSAGTSQGLTTRIDPPWTWLASDSMSPSRHGSASVPGVAQIAPLSHWYETYTGDGTSATTSAGDRSGESSS